MSTHSEWPIFDILLYTLVVPCSSNHSFNIKNSIFWVGCKLVLCGIANQTFAFSCKCYIGRSNTVSLVVGYYLDSSIFEHTDTIKRIGHNSQHNKLNFNSFFTKSYIFCMHCLSQFVHLCITTFIFKLLPRIGCSQINSNNCAYFAFLFFIFRFFLITSYVCR